MIMNLPYDFSVDFWALGIIAYELACNEVPFGENENDPFNIYSLIVEGNYKIPQFLLKTNTINLYRIPVG